MQIKTDERTITKILFKKIWCTNKIQLIKLNKIEQLIVNAFSKNGCKV